jgi:MYXO-CTERM domain-containing protein
MLKWRYLLSRNNMHNPQSPGRDRKEEEMARRRTRWKLVLPTAALSAFPFTVYTSTAQAFFPPVSPPPGVVVVQPPPTTPPVVVVPPVLPPPFVPPPPPVIVPPTIPPPVVVPPTPPPPQSVPEPSSLVMGLGGLAAAAGWVARRRRKV